jgi:simple sugar transport system ATP-binding protein
MIGSKTTISDQKPQYVSSSKSAESPVLSVANLEMRDVVLKKSVLTNVSFRVHAGEILGIAGVEGNGQTPLARFIANPKAYSFSALGQTLFGGQQTLQRTSGEMRIFGQDAKHWGSRELRRRGVGVIPEDRCREGLVLPMSAAENLILGFEDCPQFQRFQILRRKGIAQSWKDAAEAFDIRPKDPGIEAGQMSGGNQQKLILARELRFNPKFVLCCHPTRGIDIAAAELVYQHLNRAKMRGAGILLISSSLDEIFRLADRILVVYEGQIVGEVNSKDTSPEAVGYLMTGARTHGTS